MMNSVVTRVGIPVLCFIAGFMLHGECPTCSRAVSTAGELREPAAPFPVTVSTTGSSSRGSSCPPAPKCDCPTSGAALQTDTPVSKSDEATPSPPRPPAAAPQTSFSGSKRGGPVSNEGITPETRLPESTEKMGPLDATKIAQCKAVMQPDWLGGYNFQAAGLTVKPVLGPGEWSHSDKTTKPMDHHSYETIYEKTFGLYKYGREYAGKKIKVLEVGIGPAGTAKGYRLYKAYLPTIEYFGMEVQNQLKQFATSGVNSPDEARWLESHVLIGDQSRHADRAKANEKWGPFDVIIDDGSHQSGMQTATFKHLFLEALKPGGSYIVEDLETSFMSAYTVRSQMPRDIPTSFVRMTTDLITGLHFHWFNSPSFDQCARSSSQTLPSGIKMYPELLEWIQTIECDREICVFRKRREKLQPRYQGGRKC